VINVHADDPFGIDLTAKIGTVIGSFDTTATNVDVSMKKRNGRVIALDAKAELNGKSPAAVRLVQSGALRVDDEAGLALAQAREEAAIARRSGA